MVDNPRFRGKQPAWRHVKCFLELGWWTSPMAAMAGWDNLSVKDQAEVQELVKHSPGTMKVLVRLCYFQILFIAHELFG